MLILITGMGGSGKTTTARKLSELTNGITVELDELDMCYWVNKKSGKETRYEERSGNAWLKENSYKVKIDKLSTYLSNISTNKNVFVEAKISKSQLEEMRHYFDHLFLLSPSDDTLRKRLSSRINKKNEFAKTENEQTALLHAKKSFENVCVATGFIKINGDKCLKEVCEEIIESIRSKGF